MRETNFKYFKLFRICKQTIILIPQKSFTDVFSKKHLHYFITTFFDILQLYKLTAVLRLQKSLQQ